MRARTPPIALLLATNAALTVGCDRPGARPAAEASLASVSARTDGPGSSRGAATASPAAVAAATPPAKDAPPTQRLVGPPAAPRRVRERGQPAPTDPGQPPKGGSRPGRGGSTSASGQQLRCTTEHPFWVEGRGWVAAEDLRVGDRLRGADGEPVVVTGHEVRQQRGAHYNLEVADFHTYFVRSTPEDPAVWVHNTCILPDGWSPRVGGTRGLEHSFGRHADEWAARHGERASRSRWRAIIEEASESRKIVRWDVGPKQTKTIGYFARVDGNKPFFVQYYAEGPQAGELATAFIPNKGQIRRIFDRIRARR